MSLITKGNLTLILQTIKKLLSFKADKSEVVLRSEISEDSALAIILATDLTPGGIPMAEDGSIYTDEKGDIYTL